MTIPRDNPVMRAGLLFLLALGAAGVTQAQTRPEAKAQAPGLIQGLATQTESSVGVSLIGYEFDEPKRPGYPEGVMTLKARKLGFDYSGTYAFAPQWPSAGQGWFFRGETQYAVGDVDYSSPVSGTLNGTKNWYFESRGQLGHDFKMRGYVLAPYMGLGYRYLYHDFSAGRRVTSALTDNRTYRRENRMQTASVGFTHRMQLSGGSRLSTTFEYMHLLKGVQTSKFSDMGTGKADAEMDQNSGHGLRLSSMWRSDKWSFGPTLTYWNIKDSEAVGAEGFLEPKNTTTEIGFKTSYHF